jgi:uncharacterized protein with PIN domain
MQAAPLRLLGRRRLLCDEMLAGFCRWLRAAGHDAVMAPAGASDQAVFMLARAEGRTLLTRDHGLAGHGGNEVVLLPERLDDQARVLAARLGLDWMEAPFTRCLVDNTELREATGAEAATLPKRAKALAGPFRACPACGRLYWPGSHVRRMLARLEHFQAVASEGDRRA